MNDNSFGVIGGLLLGLGAIARFIWRWEKTFTDTAVDQVKAFREENENLRKENERLHKLLSEMS